MEDYQAMIEQQTPDGDTPYPIEQNSPNQIIEQKVMNQNQENKMKDEVIVAFGQPKPQQKNNLNLDYHLLPQLIEKANASLEFESPQFIDYLTECLKAINALGQPISFVKSGQK